jgi:hypothetical protein
VLPWGTFATLFSSLDRNPLPAISFATLKEIVPIVPLCRGEVPMQVLFEVPFTVLLLEPTDARSADCRQSATARSPRLAASLRHGFEIDMVMGANQQHA